MEKVRSDHELNPKKLREILFKFKIAPESFSGGFGKDSGSSSRIEAS